MTLKQQMFKITVDYVYDCWPIGFIQKAFDTFVKAQSLVSSIGLTKPSLTSGENIQIPVYSLSAQNATGKVFAFPLSRIKSHRQPLLRMIVKRVMLILVDSG